MSKVVQKAGGGVVSKSRSKKASGKVVSVAKKAAGSKPRAPGSKTSSHILSAPDGYRTLTHDQIKRAVESVFAKRYSVR